MSVLVYGSPVDVLDGAFAFWACIDGLSRLLAVKRLKGDLET
jgi:hypothetical protein